LSTPDQRATQCEGVGDQIEEVIGVHVADHDSVGLRVVANAAQL
jgi:hypothetical protein